MANEDQRTDGGIAEEEIFGTADDMDDVRESPAERLQRVFDFYVYAPLSVAWSDWRTRIGGLGVMFYILMGTVGVIVVPRHSLNEGPRYTGAFQSMDYPLGTDHVGRSIGKQLVHATPAMLKMGLAGVTFAVGLGVLVGFTAGYKGGQLDAILMTAADIMITLPGLPLIIVIASVYPPEDPFMVGAILAIDSWPGLARTLRSQVLTLREEDYVEAARAMGLSTSTIIGQELMPKLAPYILIGAATSAVAVIGASVALYFLGILPFNVLNWGVMMNYAHTEGNAIIRPEQAGHWMLFPALALAGMTFTFVLFSQGMDQVFNPRLRARHAKTASDEEAEAGGGML